MSTEAAYSIADLARLTGVNVRTIRYYLAQGLLPTSGESGPGAHYGDGHLHRLLLTRRLQEQHLPLAEIRRRLAELTDAEVASFVESPPEPALGITSSALDYVRAVLGTEPALALPPAAAATPPASAAAPSSAATLEPRPTRAGQGRPGPALLRRALNSPARLLSEPSAMPLMRDAAPTDRMGSSPPSPPSPSTEPPGPERSSWERLALGPNVEIHVRRPLSRPEQRRVERLITIARQVLKEDHK